MIADLTAFVNDLGVDVAQTMYLDLRPDERLTPAPARNLSEQPALAYLAGLGKGSQRPMWHALRVVAAILSSGELNPLTLPWHQLRRQHVNAVRAMLVDSYSPATGQRMMAALRGTLREAWKLELMTTDAYMRAIDVKAIAGSGPDHAAGRALEDGEVRAILAICRLDRSAAGPRDAAILGLGLRCGLRREEIAGLQVDSINGEQIRVTGKGNKTRTVYIGRGLDGALADWLHLRGCAAGPLFLSVNKAGKIGAGGVSAEAIYKMVGKRAKQAGVQRFTPHDLRRTFAGDLLDAGTDTVTVQKLMGHASPETTAGYDRRGERTKRAAAGRLHLPWQRKFEEDQP